METKDALVDSQLILIQWSEKLWSNSLKNRQSWYSIYSYLTSLKNLFRFTIHSCTMLYERAVLFVSALD